MRSIAYIDTNVYFAVGDRTPMWANMPVFHVDNLVIVGIDAQTAPQTWSGGRIVSGLGGWSVEFTLMGARPYAILNVGQLMRSEIDTRRRWNIAGALHGNIRALNIMTYLYDLNGGEIQGETVATRVTGGIWQPDARSMVVPSTWWRWDAPSNMYNQERLSFVAYDDYAIALGDKVGALSANLTTDPMGMNIGGLWRGTAIQYTPTVAQQSGLGYYSVDGLDIIARRHDCNNIVNLRWWSPTVGGWKSAAWEVVGHQLSSITAMQYWRTDNQQEYKTGRYEILARLPMCTYRDYMYYSDILLSDEVYSVRYDAHSVTGNAGITTRRILVRGTTEARRPDSIADLNIIISGEEVAQW